MKYVYRKNNKLSQVAKNIFGSDLVVTAYLVAYDNRELDPLTHAYMFEALSNSSFIEPNSNSLEDYPHILIKFVNGKFVFFTNSEWASISTPNMELFDKL